jgi:DNA repair photolyase
MKEPFCEKASPKTHMYPLSKKQWNPSVGCGHGCVYCESSFQRQLKRWAKGNCQECYDFSPHFHPERLTESLPKTKGREFIFVCANGDWAFALPEWRQAILNRIRVESDRTFLIQSKNPYTFFQNRIPPNVILGTTIETDREDIIEGISKAPAPIDRQYYLYRHSHKRKMVTFEPILDFNIEQLIEYAKAIKPEMVWVGYDSKRNYLPEPELERTLAFIEQLERQGFYVVRKLLRKAWWE